jgi:hypothetical protein
MPGTNEAFSRVRIDAQLKDQGWEVLNPNAVRFESVLPDKIKADYVLCDHHGRALTNPPNPVRDRAQSLMFTKNPPHGRYGLFPYSGTSASVEDSGEP